MTDTPKKITRKREIKYPRQIIIMASDELADAIEGAAGEEHVSKSVVARRWLEAGREVERHDADDFGR